jgi:hypothetical protein
MIAWNGLWAKAVPTVVTGAVGAAAYEGLRKAAGKVPMRKATVIATAWGLRGVRKAERKAQESSEQARLTVADVIAEARELVGEEASLSVVTDSGKSHES